MGRGPILLPTVLYPVPRLRMPGDLPQRPKVVAQMYGKT
jgi:hypothetical protein